MRWVLLATLLETCIFQLSAGHCQMGVIVNFVIIHNSVIHRTGGGQGMFKVPFSSH